MAMHLNRLLSCVSGTAIPMLHCKPLLKLKFSNADCDTEWEFAMQEEEEKNKIISTGQL